jgi:hypothetical protein
MHGRDALRCFTRSVGVTTMGSRCDGQCSASASESTPLACALGSPSFRMSRTLRFRAASSSGTVLKHEKDLVGDRKRPRCYRCQKSLEGCKSVRGEWPNKYHCSGVCSANKQSVNKHDLLVPCVVCKEHRRVEQGAIVLLEFDRVGPPHPDASECASITLSPPVVFPASPATTFIPLPTSAPLPATEISSDASVQATPPVIAPSFAKCDVAPLANKPSVDSARRSRSPGNGPPECVTFHSTLSIDTPSAPAFLHRRFVFDYAAGNDDSLPALLKALGASVILQLEHCTDELIVDTALSSNVSAQVSQTNRSRMAQWVVNAVSTPSHKRMRVDHTMTHERPLEDRRLQARRMKCRIHDHQQLLAAAKERNQQEDNAKPCIIIGDEANMYRPEITFFPMIRVPGPAATGRGNKPVAASSSPVTTGSTLIHTLPRIDWDAPAGRSAFINGMQRAEDLAREHREKEQRGTMAEAVKAGDVKPEKLAHLLAHQKAKRTAASSKAAAAPLPAPRLLYCEICRRHCDSEQIHHNTPSHQRLFDSEAQIKPLEEELDAQRKWNTRNFYMETHLKEIREEIKTTGKIKGRKEWQKEQEEMKQRQQTAAQEERHLERLNSTVVCGTLSERCG